MIRTTGVELPFCLCQVKSFEKSLYVSPKLLMTFSETNKLDFARGADYEKAFDSIHRDSLWQILRAYGIPQRIVNIIKCFYSNFTCTSARGISVLKLKLVYGSDVSCRLCYSILLSIGFFVA